MPSDETRGPQPDPTELTTAAVDRATEVFRRELVSLHDVLSTRMDGNDEDRGKIWQRLQELPGLYEIFTNRLRDDLIARDVHTREVITQRINDLDTAAKLAAERIERIPADNQHDAAALAADFRDSLRSEREFIQCQITALRDVHNQRLSGMDEATKLLAEIVSAIPEDITKSTANMKEIIDTRLAAMDEATKLLATNVDKVPYAILQEAGNLKSFIMSRIEDVSHVSYEKFTAVDALFASNALALTAALAAQEKAVAEQNRSNTLAITKSEVSTKETIAANAAQTQTGLQSQADTIADLKERVVRIESMGVGTATAKTEARAEHTEQRLSQGAIVSLVVAFVIVAGFIITLITVLHK